MGQESARIIEKEERWLATAKDSGTICMVCSAPLTKDEYDMYTKLCSGCAHTLQAG